MTKANRFLLLVMLMPVLCGTTWSAQSATGAGPEWNEQLKNQPVAHWSLESFDRFTRIEIGQTPKPWLNILGNGLFGGHLILLLANRGDGQELCVDTATSSTLRTDLNLTGLGKLRETTHGIGYSTLTFGDTADRFVHVTYFLEPNAQESEIWLVENAGGATVTLRYGSKNTTFERSVAFRIVNDRIDQISIESARGEKTATQQKWQEYLAGALDHIGIQRMANPLLLREFVWDIYQVVAMVSSDRYADLRGANTTLRNANMGGTYTFLGLDVHGRDTLQMVPAISRFDPVLAREILLNMARYTDKTGRVCHRRLLSGQPMDRGHSDESYWLVIALIDYVQSTNDMSVLEERAPYLENDLISEYVLFKDQAWVRRFDAKNIDPARFTAEHSSVLEHARRAVENVSLGPHGLPLLEDGDWNDALNHMQKGESVMNAGLYAYSLLQLSELWRQLGKPRVDSLLGAGSYEHDLHEYSDRYEQIKRAVNENAWDGEWYVRGFDNQGKPFGSRTNAEGKIYLNAQSWLIRAKIPDEQRTASMIRAVNRYLRRDDKLSLLTPVYSKPDDSIGNITLLPRGSNENGGQWRQCTLWWISALRQSGQEADALVLFDQLLLVNANLNKMQTEPYLYNEYLRGPEAADPGSAGQQAHVQQAALVLGLLVEVYPQVKVTGTFSNHYDFPGMQSEEQLYSFTGSGEKVPWLARWVRNPDEYHFTALGPEVTTR